MAQLVSTSTSTLEVVDSIPSQARLNNSNKMEDADVKELSCPICMDKYIDPKLLPCGHTQCLQCLLSWVKSFKNSSPTCPQCRQPITSRRSSDSEKLCKIIADLPTNRIIEAEMEEEQLKNPRCVMCSNNEATHVCQNCFHLKLCHMCSIDHSAIDFGITDVRNHNVVKIESASLNSNDPEVEKLLEKLNEQERVIFECKKKLNDRSMKESTNDALSRLEALRYELHDTVDENIDSAKETVLTTSYKKNSREVLNKLQAKKGCIALHKTMANKITKLKEHRHYKDMIKMLDSRTGDFKTNENFCFEGVSFKTNERKLMSLRRDIKTICTVNKQFDMLAEFKPFKLDSSILGMVGISEDRCTASVFFDHLIYTTNRIPLIAYSDEPMIEDTLYSVRIEECNDLLNHVMLGVGSGKRGLADKPLDENLLVRGFHNSRMPMVVYDKEYLRYTESLDTLAVNHRVGVVITSDRRLRLYINEEFQCEAKEPIPDKPHHFVMDLRGRCHEITALTKRKVDTEI